MAIDDTVYQFSDVVPQPRELGFVETYFPTFLRWAERFGLAKRAPEPIVKKKDYPAIVRIVLPEIPFLARDDGEIRRPFVYVFDRIEEVVDKMIFEEGLERRLNFLMDKTSFERFYSDIPAREDDNMFGDVMNVFSVVYQYAQERFEPKGFKIRGCGTSTEIGRASCRERV